MPDTAKLATALAGQYVIERELGAGGMATVYLARDTKHERDVALKVLRPELGAVLGAERFLAEVKITARLDHPHILTLIDSGSAAGYLYYVLPYVRGESLRVKLDREKQLSLEEALSITKQVGSALDYAHQHGVVHRDIKPENILLHEGEAVLADFGIALAVKEAGGNRLTETGLSLGTPQYMSPEQATGDRQLDARSDVYSLAAVLYEMLAGEPPVTGPTAQAMIAKLITERPVHLRVVRDTVPPEVDAAVAKALSKIAADRFASAGDFVRACEVRAARSSRAAVLAGMPLGRRAAMLGGVLVVLAGGALALGGRFGRHRAAFALRDRTQLTFSGTVATSAISPDGKQLAFFSKSCTEAACSYAIDVQDVGGTTTHRVLDHATAAYGISWSPDRRNLLATATVNGRWGTYLVSTLGGAPRYLSSGPAAFWAGGDSLLVTRGIGGGPFWVRVTSLDGVVADSIPVPGEGTVLAGLAVTPDARWIIALIVQNGHGLWQVLDRAGKVADHVLNSCTCPGLATSDALWVERAGQGEHAIVHMQLDPRTGRLSARQDTLYSGAFGGFTITADGTWLVIDDGTQDFSLWAVATADALRGRFGDNRRLVRTSTPLGGQVSVDGRRVLVYRTLPSNTGRNEIRLSVVAFDGGPETPLTVAGIPYRVAWYDSVTIAVASNVPQGTHLALYDVRTGAPRLPLDLPDSSLGAITPLPDGWAWVKAGGDTVVVRRGAATSAIARPAWYGTIIAISADRAGRRLALTGWNQATFDTLGVSVVSLGSPAAAPEPWTRRFAENGGARFLGDGSVLFAVWPTQESAELWRLTGPHRAARLGAVPRPVVGLTASDDLRRLAALERDYHGDAWMSRVVRQ